MKSLVAGIIPMIIVLVLALLMFGKDIFLSTNGELIRILIFAYVLLIYIKFIENSDSIARDKKKNINLENENLELKKYINTLEKQINEKEESR